MAGGNDGLNTVVPANDGAYYDLRKNLAVPQKDILPINNQAGFHPGLASFKELWDEGALAVVEGVGYPRQSFSHFESMDIWQTGGSRQTGVGRLAGPLPPGHRRAAGGRFSLAGGGRKNAALPVHGKRLRPPGEEH